ncbi:MAG: AAA family ATPase [Desulfopila sp.]
MPVISISRGSYHRGRDVAHAVAEMLRYECISRDSLLENSDIYDTPEIRLLPNVKHAAQVLEHFSFGRERYVNYMSSSVLRFLKKDNHVYHGLAGQFFVSDVSHVIKIRIIADLGERVAAEAKRSGLDPDRVRDHLTADDEERRKWAKLLYGIDISDPQNYDMVLNISTMSVQDAAALIAQAASFPCYQATAESIHRIENLALQSEVKAALFDYPQAKVIAEDGLVHIHVKAPADQEEAVRQRIETVLEAIPEVKKREVTIAHYY